MPVIANYPNFIFVKVMEQ